MCLSFSRMLPPLSQILIVPLTIATETLISLYNDIFSIPQPEPQARSGAEPTLAVVGMEAAHTLAVSELHVWFGQEACAH